ncbi:MAG: class I SAM-dependent methyltransferase [Bdellovibrionota bacterium]
MGELNLLDLYPKAKRDLNARQAATPEDRRIAKQFGMEYFDGTRNQGYGGYRYDGRWKPIVRRFQEHYGLTSNSRVLDVGCAKGFMLHDFYEAIPGISLAGIDVSQYALDTAMPSVRPFLTIGNAKEIPFEDKSFDLVIAINSIHNLEIEDLKQSLREINRVSRGNAFVVVDAYRSDEEREAILRWNLTAATYLHVDEWKAVFAETGYKGDYYWFIP